MKAITKRICIYPKDIERITGKSYRQSTRILKAIKKSNNGAASYAVSESLVIAKVGKDSIKIAMK